MQVDIVKTGSHTQAETGEAAELVQLLLEKCGYTKNLSWECRVDKMRTTSAEARPIRVMGHKKFGITLRVKPAPNSNYDQQMTLLIPDGSGYRAEDLFNQMRGAEKGISRRWRENLRKLMLTKQPAQPAPVTTTQPSPYLQRLRGRLESPPPSSRTEPPKPERTPPPVEEKSYHFPDLKGVRDDPEKLGFILRRIHQVHQSGVRGKKQFPNAVIKACKWEHLGKRICSRVVGDIERDGYLTQVVDAGDRLIGFALTEKGCQAAGINVSEATATVRPSPLQQQTVVAEPPTNFMQLVIDIHDKAQELADVGKRIRDNEERRKTLLEEIRKIDAENKELLSVISTDPQTYKSLKDLMSKVTLLPMSGASTSSSGQTDAC